MKRGFLQLMLGMITGLVCQVTFTQAQSYHPMPTGPAQWNMARCWYFYPAGWHDLYYITMDGTDTILNNKEYKKLYHTTHHAPGTEFDSTYTHFLGGMREEGKKVFMYSEWLCLDTMERMIYDFNDVTTGDIIYTQVLTNGSTQFIKHNVTGVDEVDVNGTPRRQIHITDENGFFNETWIEGIGSSMGLVYASYWLLTDNSYDLNCFYEGKDLQYKNPSPAYAFCTAPYPDSECDSVLTNVGPEPRSFSINLYPNPVVTSLFVECSTKIESIQVFNSLGTQIMDIPFTPQLDFGKLPAGFYLLRFNGKSNDQRVVWRIIKL